MYYAGIDIGSTTTKAVIINEQEVICSYKIMDTLVNQEKSAQMILNRAMEELHIQKKQIAFIAATGYGRKVCRVKNIEIPEIICHGVGTKGLVKNAGSVIDIGGQDSKAIELDEKGKVIHFEMNDKCAAGTGRFFEVLCKRLLKLPMEELSGLTEQAEHPVQISSMCTIFAETEIISYLAQGVGKEDIAAGMSYAIAKRIQNMAKAGQVRLKDQVVFTGGAANNEGLRKIFEKLLGQSVITVDYPQSPAAFGAAIMAHRYYEKNGRP